ncbi:hypothetical protein PAALTS15_23358 [Paenibacillus alvei TS-15]|uniref:Uncharacterized protein n=1 Tax=Paenibacillus alvei TS-15 TaxID=1117108 RepID=S9SLB5_PAEAL|nr:hypothetical protein PAALTS15_23358 [Paenibacillus alvei TS-15]
MKQSRIVEYGLHGMGTGDVDYGSMNKKAAIYSSLPAQVDNGGQSIVVSSAEELIPCTTILKAMPPFG